VAEIAAELGENLVGIYLIGSIASGDFDSDSDVDFLVVTNTDLAEANMKSLQDIQIKIHDIDCYPAKHLEGSYISISDLSNWNIVGEKKLNYFDNGSTTYEKSTHDNQWHVRWILRERGITLVGPKPETILKSVPLNEMLNEIKRTMLQVMNFFKMKSIARLVFGTPDLVSPLLF
jgi:predicted nucleotidyltransferase